MLLHTYQFFWNAYILLFSAYIFKQRRNYWHIIIRYLKNASMITIHKQCVLICFYIYVVFNNLDAVRSVQMSSIGWQHWEGRIQWYITLISYPSLSLPIPIIPCSVTLYLLITLVLFLTWYISSYQLFLEGF